MSAEENQLFKEISNRTEEDYIIQQTLSEVSHELCPEPHISIPKNIRILLHIYHRCIQYAILQYLKSLFETTLFIAPL